MRLTNDIREKTIKAVLDEKIQTKVEKEREKVLKVIEKEAGNIYPEKVKKWMSEAPHKCFDSRNMFRIGIDRAAFWHPLFQTDIAAFTPVYKKWFKTNTCFPVLPDYTKDMLEASAHSKRSLLAISKRLNALAKKREDMLGTLNSALYSCTTIEKFKKQFPSLVKYMPKIQVVSTAIVISDSDVVKAIS